MSQAASAPMFPYWKAVLAAVLIHLFFFAAVSLSLVTPPRFGVAAGAGGIEVSLVAAPEKQAEKEAPLEEEIPPPPPGEVVEDDMALTRVETPAIPPPPAPKLAEPKLDATKVDAGRAAVRDHGSAQSSRSGDVVDVRPNYLRNPAPPYPEKARRAGQTGTVRLKVIIDEKGQPIDAIIRSSSGYRILDETARTHILRTWRFQPAKVAGIAVKSRVEIPVRFQMDR